MGYGYPAAPAEILLVDDDADCAYLTQRAFGQAKLRANLHHVDDGRKCLAFLRQQPPYAAAPVPDIVLLDLEMPVMDGRHVLAEIVKDESLKHLAVVVLTSQDEPADILRMYQLRCSSYIRKPPDYERYVEMIGKLADYWLSVVMFPGKRAVSEAMNDRSALEPARATADHKESPTPERVQSWR
ncbi:MAG: response regulator [Betaproteobacteria bacterium]|nr:MAG: response regulator [Betaproteobacteria bacterium]RPI48337.1 MAG: response regulator [Betaproteobacteria bacterium]